MAIINFITIILKKILISFVRLYQILISPLLGANKCRFQPSCSHYMIQAIEKKGIVKGLWKGAGRVLRCHPWSQGGNDPVL